MEDVVTLVNTGLLVEDPVFEARIRRRIPARYLANPEGEFSVLAIPAEYDDDGLRIHSALPLIECNAEDCGMWIICPTHDGRKDNPGYYYLAVDRHTNMFHRR